MTADISGTRMNLLNVEEVVMCRCIVTFAIPPSLQAISKSLQDMESSSRESFTESSVIQEQLKIYFESSSELLLSGLQKQSECTASGKLFEGKGPSNDFLGQLDQYREMILAAFNIR